MQIGQPMLTCAEQPVLVFLCLCGLVNQLTISSPSYALSPPWIIPHRFSEQAGYIISRSLQITWIVRGAFGIRSSLVWTALQLGNQSIDYTHLRRRVYALGSAQRPETEPLGLRIVGERIRVAFGKCLDVCQNPDDIWPAAFLGVAENALQVVDLDMGRSPRNVVVYCQIYFGARETCRLTLAQKKGILNEKL